jgi:hypothetical protein
MVTRADRFLVFWIALDRVSSVVSGTLEGGVDDGRHELGNCG